MVMVALTKLAEFAEQVCTTLARQIRCEPHVGTSRFPRRLQMDGWSCGSRSTQAIAIHFGRDVSHARVMAGVGTTTDGTAATPIARYLRTLGHRAGYHRRMTFRQLARALDRGGVVLVDINGVHWSVVYAASDDHVWLANPSLKQFGRRITKTKFRAWWTGSASP